MKNAKATIEYSGIDLDVIYDYYKDDDMDNIEIELNSVFVSGSSVNIWDLMDAGDLISSLEREIYEQIHCL